MARRRLSGRPGPKPALRPLFPPEQDGSAGQQNGQAATKKRAPPRKTATPRAKKKMTPTPQQAHGAIAADKSSAATPTATPVRTKRKSRAMAEITKDGGQAEPKRRKRASGDKKVAPDAGKVAEKNGEGKHGGEATVESKKAAAAENLRTSHVVKKTRKSKKTPGDHGVQKAAKTKVGKGQAVPIAAGAPVLSEAKISEQNMATK